MKQVYIIYGRTLNRSVCHGHGDYSDEWDEYVACGLAFASKEVAIQYMHAAHEGGSNAPLEAAEEYAIKEFPVQS